MVILIRYHLLIHLMVHNEYGFSFLHLKDEGRGVNEQKFHLDGEEVSLSTIRSHFANVIQTGCLDFFDEKNNALLK